MAHLLGRRLRRRRPARRPAGGGEPARGRPARVLPGAGHVVVPEPRASGRRCPPPTVPTSGSASTWSSTRPARTPEGQSTEGCGDPDSSPSRRVNVVVPADPIEPVALDPIEVTNVEIDEQSVEFDVSELGVPVLVKVSYFPNWEVDGRRGPVPGRPQLHGRRPHRHPRQAGVRALEQRPRASTRHDRPRPRRRHRRQGEGSDALPGPRRAGGRRAGAVAGLPTDTTTSTITITATTTDRAPLR